MSRDRGGHLWVLYVKSVPWNGLWERRGLECDADEPRFTAPGDPALIARSCWRRPMRLMLIVVTVAVVMLVDLRVSQATQMPWCAGTSTGHAFHYNCSLPTYEMCVQEVIAGNRGFCSPNPYYRGPDVPLRAKRKRYYR